MLRGTRAEAVAFVGDKANVGMVVARIAARAVVGSVVVLMLGMLGDGKIDLDLMY